MNEAIASVERSLKPERNGTWVTPEDWDEVVKVAKIAFRGKTDRGKENGTRIHKWLEKFCIAKRDGTSEPELPKPVEVPKLSKDTGWDEVLDIDVKIEWNNLIEALSQFVGYWSAHEIEVVALERIIYSRQYDYAGRFDAILRIDGELCLVDFKTNNPTREYPQGVFPEMFCQIGGYDVAYTEENYPELHQKNQSCFNAHVVFNFSKRTGKFNKKFLRGEDLRLNRTWFTHALGVKRAMQHRIRGLSMIYKENQKKG